MDIAGYLRGLGLERFADAFRAAEIDAEILPELTEADLEKLGIPLGPRKRLLKAIASLAETAQPSAAIPHDAARRHLTVMFCDLVGSTALSTRLDPEDLRDVIGRYQRCVTETVVLHGGYVAKFMGDGVLVYFGYPQAHEDDAERAVRARLALIEAVGALTN